MANGRREQKPSSFQAGGLNKQYVIATAMARTSISGSKSWSVSGSGSGSGSDFESKSGKELLKI